MASLKATVLTMKGKDGKSHDFAVKDTTKRNRDEIAKHLNVYQEQIQQAAEKLVDAANDDGLELDEIDKLDIPDFDKYDLDFKMFCWLTTGPHDLLDPDDFNVKMTEVARAAFLPESSTTTDVLLQFLV